MAQRKKANPIEVAEKQANHPDYKWYDEFLCHIDKVTQRNRATRQQETIVNGWTLYKKEKSVFIEEHLVWSPQNGMNTFATVENSTIFARLYLEKDKYKQGDFVTAKIWAESFIEPLSEEILITLKLD